jgi:hypothetical protein
LEKVVRLGRKYGFGLVVSTQQIEDVPKVFINSCALLMLHQQREHRYFGREVLGFGEFEDAYLTAAGQGEMLLFDRGVAQKGQLWPDYIKGILFQEQRHLRFQPCSESTYLMPYMNLRCP